MLVKLLPTLSCQGFSLKYYQIEYKFYVGFYMVFGVEGRKIWVNCEKLAQWKFAKIDLKGQIFYLIDHLLQKCT